MLCAADLHQPDAIAQGDTLFQLRPLEDSLRIAISKNRTRCTSRRVASGQPGAVIRAVLGGQCSSNSSNVGAVPRPPRACPPGKAAPKLARKAGKAVREVLKRDLGPTPTYPLMEKVLKLVGGKRMLLVRVVRRILRPTRRV